MKTLLLFIAFLCASLATAAPSLVLSWTDNSDNEAGFRVERRVGNGPWTTLATLPANTVTAPDAGPFSANQTLEYRVCAFNAWGDSAWSNTATVQTATPQAPGAIKVTVQVEVGVLRKDYPLIAATLVEEAKP